MVTVVTSRVFSCRRTNTLFKGHFWKPTRILVFGDNDIYMYSILTWYLRIIIFCLLLLHVVLYFGEAALVWDFFLQNYAIADQHWSSNVISSSIFKKTWFFPARREYWPFLSEKVKFLSQYLNINWYKNVPFHCFFSFLSFGFWKNKHI